MHSYADLIKSIESNLKFQSGGDVLPEPGDVDLSITEAIGKYSQDRPRRLTVMVVGDGGNRYDLPSDWDSNFSQITRIEFIDRDLDTSGDQPAPICVLKAQDVLIWDDGNGEKFHFQYMNLRAASGGELADHAVIQYTGVHEISESENTVPDSDFVALTYLSTSRAAWKAAGRGIGGSGFNSPGGQGVLGTLRTQSDLYAKFAKDMMKLYYEQMNINPDETTVPPVIVHADVDLDLPWITHRNR